MIVSIVDNLKNKLSDELIVFIVSMLPILELRGGLIASAILGIKWYIAFPICVIGNMLPIPLELLFIRKIFNLLKKIKGIGKIVNKLDERAKRKGIEISTSKYAFWGLFALVAIPLPGTGAWTGGLVADVIDIRALKALPIITAGVITAGLITSLISYVVPQIFI